MTKTVIAIHAETVLAEYPKGPTRSELRQLPDDVVVFFPECSQRVFWYRKDLTPMLLQDVPKQARAMVLLLS